MSKVNNTISGEKADAYNFKNQGPGQANARESKNGFQVALAGGHAISDTTF